MGHIFLFFIFCVSVNFWVTGLAFLATFITFFGFNLPFVLEDLACWLSSWMINRLCLAGEQERIENIQK